MRAEPIKSIGGSMSLRKHLLTRDFLAVISLVAGRQWLMLIPVVVLFIYDAIRKDVDL